MSGFSEIMQLKEQAEEDVYFARRDRELIRALHEQEAAETSTSDGCTRQRQRSARVQSTTHG